MKLISRMDSPVGILTIYTEDQYLTAIDFNTQAGIPDWNDQPIEQQMAEKAILMKEVVSDPLHLMIHAQLREYFAGERREFDLPLKMEGTSFQKRVWAALARIPYGETRSYKEIAQMADSPKGFRAVGMANHNNPIPIVIPCHRVIGADGSLTGYGGGLDKKVILLNLEKEADK